jgi:hypothetical protein
MLAPPQAIWSRVQVCLSPYPSTIPAAVYALSVFYLAWHESAGSLMLHVRTTSYERDPEFSM